MKILFAFAHPDDEAFGPCCTIQKLVQQGHEVIVTSMCNGMRPGAVHVSSARIAAFQSNCEFLGVAYEIAKNPDLTLGYAAVVRYAVDLIQRHQPSVVYTNNISDINADHRLLAEACMVASRPTPTSCVNELYFCEIPGSTDWGFGQITPTFEPNVYVDISSHIETKHSAVVAYATETRQHPDARSVEATIALAQRRGVTIGVEYAEAFKLVFSRK